MVESAVQSLRDLLAAREASVAADAARFEALDSDACQLCEAYGADKRCLVIDCFYDLHESVPEMIDLSGVRAPTLRDRGFYLRICKACRGRLLHALGVWRRLCVDRRGLPMDHDGNDEPADPERNIPLRVNGALQWLTRAEWDKREATREPHL